MEKNGLKLTHARWLNPKKILEGKEHSSVVISIDLHRSIADEVSRLRQANADIVIDSTIYRVKPYLNLQPKVPTAPCQVSSGERTI